MLFKKIFFKLIETLECFVEKSNQNVCLYEKIFIFSTKLSSVSTNLERKTFEKQSQTQQNCLIYN
jgi:hypothetical protein